MGKRKLLLRSPIVSKGSPIQQSGVQWLDRAQSGLAVAGLWLPQADALNAFVSGGRAAYYGIIGDDEEAKKHLGAMAWNTAAIIPGVAEVRAGLKGATHLGKSQKLVKGAKKYFTQKPTKFYQQGKTMYKTAKNVVKGADTPGVTGDIIAGVGNVKYWEDTYEQVKSEFDFGNKKNEAKKTETKKSKTKPGTTVKNNAFDFGKYSFNPNTKAKYSFSKT